MKVINRNSIIFGSPTRGCRPPPLRTREGRPPLTNSHRSPASPASRGRARGQAQPSPIKKQNRAVMLHEGRRGAGATKTALRIKGKQYCSPRVPRFPRFPRFARADARAGVRAGLRKEFKSPPGSHGDSLPRLGWAGQPKYEASISGLAQQGKRIKKTSPEGEVFWYFVTCFTSGDPRGAWRR
jgi:hypothetical protein